MHFRHIAEMEKDAPTSPIIKRSRPYKKVSPKESVEEGCICSEWAQDISCTAHSYLDDDDDDGGNAHEESINSDHQFPPTPQKPSIRRKRRSAYSVPTDLGSTETQKESVFLLDQDLGSTETQEDSVSLLDQDLGSTETHMESQSLLKKEEADEESNRAKLCNGMFSWSLDLEQDNI